MIFSQNGEVEGILMPVPPYPSCLVHREKMPFHHVTAGLLYKGNYLNRSLSAGSDSEQLANISVEELDGKEPPHGGGQCLGLLCV